MKTILKNILIILSLILAGCDKDALLPTDDEFMIMQDKADSKNSEVSLKATGDVEVTFMSNPGGQHGNNHQGAMPTEGQIRFADVVFDAHAATPSKEAKGDIMITIKDEFGLIKREIKAVVYNVDIDPANPEAWILALVTSDERHDGDHAEQAALFSIMAGSGNGQMNGQNGNGSHQGGPNDDGTHQDDDGTHTDDDHDSGCNSDDGTHGSNSRVGKTVGLAVYDGGTPGTNGDELRWKWYKEYVPDAAATNHGELGNMCKKEIIGGNLVVHLQ